jgi:signal peptidase II
MWLIYFVFEFATGRIQNNTILIGNILLMILFSACGYLIYKQSTKLPCGITKKQTIYSLSILIFIDQCIKLIINFFFFNSSFEIIKNFLSFTPIINSNGSWLNARFGTSISFSLLNSINIIALVLFIELYRYIIKNNKNNFFSNICFIFIFSGAFCSLIDKLFYGGSLDFIGISNLFIADIKDIYINIGILLFIVYIYNSGYLNSNDDTTIKDDLQYLTKFLYFVKYDLLSLFKIKLTKK